MIGDASNSTVIKEAIEYIENFSIMEPQEDLTYSTVFEPRVLPSEFDETGRYRIIEKVGEAGIVRNASRFNKMKISGQNVSYIVERVGIEFEVEKAELIKAVNNGRPLAAIYQDESLRTVREKLNTLAYRGDTEFGEFPGLIELSGVTTYSGTALDTADLNISNEIIKSYNKLPRKYRMSADYTLIVPDAIWQAFQVIGNQYTNESWLDMALKALNKNGRKVTIISEDEIAGGLDTAGGTIALGTALWIPKNKRYVSMPMALAPRNKVNRALSTNDYEDYIVGKSEAKVGPIEVPFPTSVVKITGWTVA